MGGGGNTHGGDSYESEEGEHELVFGRKVSVERGFGDAGCDDDFVHRDIPHRPAAEQATAGFDDAFVGVSESRGTDGRRSSRDRRVRDNA